MRQIYHPPPWSRALKEFRLLCFLLLVLRSCPFVLVLCRIVLTLSPVCVNQHSSGLLWNTSLVLSAFFTKMKKPPDPFKAGLHSQPCDHSTICALPHGSSLPPHFMASDTHTEIKLLKSHPLLGLPLKVLMTCKKTGLLLLCPCPSNFNSKLTFIVIALPLVPQLYDLKNFEWWGWLNFPCRSVCLVRENRWSGFAHLLMTQVLTCLWTCDLT